MINPPFKNLIRLQIEWGDCDPAGIVFYPNYFRMFNAATDALFAAAGFEPAIAFTRFGIIGYPMIDTSAAFSSPNRFGDSITILSFIARWGRSSFDVRHQLSNAAGESVQSSEKRVWATVDEAGRLQALPVPDEVRAAFGADHLNT